ncbi:MAG: peptidase and in kexin sedolisin, partial [Clostridiales bacterium]|nr:peptidase and in kexin sedolisin [Clostridiales bacterium]
LVKDMKSNGAKLKLSVFLNKKDVLEKLLLSEDIQNKVINELTGDFKIKYIDYEKKINEEYPSHYITDESGKPHEYDGIIIDFEGLSPALKDRFNTFIDKLKQKLPKDKTLTVCIPPKIGDIDKGEIVQYYYGYDYAHIGAVADEIILMAHDFEYSNTNLQYRISATAPYELVEEAIKNAKKDIPASKILLNISITSIQWRKGENSYQTPSYVAVMNAIEGKNINEKVLEVTDKELRYNDSLKVGHVYLKREIIYNGIVNIYEDDFYFENRCSIEDKISLVKSYNLKGLSIWRLGSAYSNDTEQNFSAELFDPIFKSRMFDLNKDDKINNQDLDIAMLSYGSKPGDSTWKKELDFDNDGVISIYDIDRIAKYTDSF